MDPDSRRKDEVDDGSVPEKAGGSLDRLPFVTLSRFGPAFAFAGIAVLVLNVIEGQLDNLGTAMFGVVPLLIGVGLCAMRRRIRRNES